jgi:hypothetical protein
LVRKAQLISAAVTKIMTRGPLVLESDTRFHLQNALYEEIHEKLHVNTLIPLFERRLRTVFAPLSIPVRSIAWNDVFAVLNKAGTHLSMVVVKTWVDSWATSTRYHDELCSSCVFGCYRERDHICHYALCPRLWTEVYEATRSPDEAPVEERLLLSSPSARRAVELAVAFSTYHAVKLGYTARVQAAERAGDYAPILELAREAAEAHAIKLDAIWKPSGGDKAAASNTWRLNPAPAADEVPSRTFATRTTTIESDRVAVAGAWTGAS